MTMTLTDLFSFLLPAAVKASAVLVGAFAVTRLVVKASAAARYLVWQLSIAAVLALTVASALITPRWRILPSFLALSSTSSVQPSERASGRASPAVHETPAPAIGAAASPRVSSTIVQSTAIERDRAAPVARSLASSYPLGTTLRALWLAGALAILLRFLIGSLAARRFTRGAQPIEAKEWARLNETMALAAGLGHPVSLLKSRRASTPMTFGVLNPVVLLPSDADEWTDERRRVVLLHELAHVRRFDALTNVLVTVACAVYWFNPLMWIAAGRMRAEAERACDDWVLRAGVQASSYADHLLSLIQSIGGAPTPAAALPMASRSTFEGRLLAILEPNMNRSGLRRGQVALLTTGIVALVLPLSAMTTAVSAAPHVSPAANTNQAQPTPPPRSDSQKSKADRAKSESPTDTDLAPPGIAVHIDREWGKTSQVQSPMSQSALDGLVAASKDSDVGVRLESIRALGKSGDPRAIAALSEALRSDRDVAVRRAAAWALGNLDDTRAVPALTTALKADTSVEVRRTVVWALGEIGDKSASSSLSQSLTDRDVQVRRDAVWALGEIGDHGSAAAIETLFKDKDASVRQQAVWAVGEIGSHESVGALTALLYDTSSAVRNQAAWALGEIGDRSAVDALGNALRADSDAGVRETAAWALGELGDADAVPALSAGLADPSDRVRSTCAWALGEISPHTAPTALINALTDPVVEVRRNAVWALAQIGDRGGASAQALRAATRDSDPGVKRGALRALAMIGDSTAYDALAEMLKDPDPAVRKEAAAALGGRASGWAEPRPRPRPQPQPRPRPDGW
jgi:HEAT repeat protein/beta-lactamase regulating signal transducer with metallopeptidase domain